MGRYSLGLDFGTLSVRALIVEMATGKEVVSYENAYQHGVLDQQLPDGTRLGVDWALQVPNDYIESMANAVAGALRTAEISGDEIAGIGIDFTSCTILPVLADGTPLCELPGNQNKPHAYVKLWMHHAAANEAELISEIARQYASKWIDRYSGRISSEFMYPKVLQVLNEAPEIYRQADMFLEAGDWLVWRMTGKLARNACAAGYKAMWHSADGYPPKAFFRKLDVRLENLVEEKLKGDVVPVGNKAGSLSAEIAGKMKLKPGIPVAVSTIDGHCTFPSLGVSEPGTLMIIMGTSGCHLTIDNKEVDVQGMCGVVRDGVLPGFFGYESGQSGFGTHMAWFLDNCLPESYATEAKRRGIEPIEYVTELAEKLIPGQNGLIGLDWWNGNRSVFNNHNLSGLLLGLTYQTKPEDIFLALLEAVAFGTRRIVDSYDEAGIHISRIVAVGGIPEKNKLLMQICSDVLGRPIQLAGSAQGAALGAAIYGAVVAGKENGGYNSIIDAVNRMGSLKDTVYHPIAERKAAYGQIYSDYLFLYDLFGKNDLMGRIKNRRRDAIGKMK